MDASSLHAIGHLCDTAYVDADVHRLKSALVRTAPKYQSRAGDRSLDLLEAVGREVNFRVIRLSRTVREAIALAKPGTPMAIRSSGSETEPARWIILIDGRGDRALICGQESGTRDEWVRVSDLVQWLGLQSSKQEVEWAMVVASQPCEAASHHAETESEGHDDGHDHHDHDGHPHGMHPLRRLFGLIHAEMRDIRVIIAFAIAVGILGLATPLAVESLVSMVAFGTFLYPVVVVSILLMGCLSLAAVFYALQAIVSEIIQRRIYVRIVGDLSFRLPRIQRRSLDLEHGPELVNRYFDIMTVQKACSTLLLDGVALVLNTTIGLIVLAFYHPFLLGFDLVLLAAIAFTIFLLGRGGIRSSIAESRQKYATAYWLEELTRNNLSFKTRAGSELALERADTLAKDYVDRRREHFRILIRQVYFALGLQVVASTVLLGLGGWLVIRGQLTLGQLIASELIVTTIVGSVAKMGKQFDTFYDLMAGMDKLGHLFDLPMERTQGMEFESSNPNGVAIAMRNVSFRYETGRTILDGVSLDLAPGERVALMGPSGSGKSSLSDLLYGLRQPQSGSIELDATDVRDIRLESLRESVALVRDQTEIIEGSILDNIQFGRHGLALAEVRRSLEAVGLWDEVSREPNGIHTRLSADGTPMSRGQARRLMLARAIVGRPSLLILDEVLDTIDVNTRGLVLRSLLAPDAPWTLLVITHDPALGRQFDRCLILREGHLNDGEAINGVAEWDHWREGLPASS